MADSDKKEDGSPRSVDVDTLADDRQARIPSRFFVFVAGALMGGVSFVICMAAIPPDAIVMEHDLALAKNMGSLYPPILGYWCGFSRRSLRWMFLGIAMGMLIGALYRLLCGYDFLGVMVLFPCLLSGLASLILGHGQRPYVKRAIARLLKGLLAGFVLGFVYMFVLILVSMFVMQTSYPSTPGYRHMMWYVGTTAMAVSSGLYLLLFHWASDIARPTWFTRKAGSRRE